VLVKLFAEFISSLEPNSSALYRCTLRKAMQLVGSLTWFDEIRFTTASSKLHFICKILFLITGGQYLYFLPLSLIYFIFFVIIRWALASFSVFLILYTVGRTPWTGDQPFARQLPAHRTKQTQNNRTHPPMPPVGFEHTISLLEKGEDSSCLRPRGHCDRFSNLLPPLITFQSSQGRRLLLLAPGLYVEMRILHQESVFEYLTGPIHILENVLKSKK
jgi:hypothetical protein